MKFNTNKSKTVILSILLLIISISIVIIGSISVGSDNSKVIIKADLEKYINYEISENDKGTLVQYGLEISTEDNNSQISDSKTQIKLSQIDNKYPNSVKVISKNTNLTNGNSSNNNYDYQYNNKNGQLIIIASNKNANNELINNQIPNKDAKDEYKIICYYDTYSSKNPQRDLKIELSTIINLENQNNDKTLSLNKQFGGTISENKGDLTSLLTTTDEIYNGYIKSNILNGTKYATKYCEKQEIIISKKEAQENLNLYQSNTFVKLTSNQNGEEKLISLGNNNQLIYESTKIYKDNLLNVLGENGKLQIFDESNNQIAEINKDTKYENDGTFTITYENPIKNITIKTSNIQNEGILKIENTKQITSTLKDLDNVKIFTDNHVVGINNQEKIQNDEKTTVESIAFNHTNQELLEIKDSITNISLNINTSDWTNEKQNDITFDISLNSNSNKYNMFNNPSIKINLPAQVEKVILTNSSILYANGLELQNPNVITNNDGTLSIVANLTGKQTQYNTNNFGLTTNIKIPATIILKKDIQNVKENITLEYINNYTLNGTSESGNISKQIQLNSYKESNQSTTQIPQSTSTNNINSTTQINNDSVELTVSPIKGNTVIKNADTIYEGEYIKYKVSIKNTSTSDIQNLKLVGNIPNGSTYANLYADRTNPDGQYYYKFDDSIKQKIFDIGTLKPNEIYNDYFEVIVNDLENGLSELNMTSQINAYINDQIAQIYEQTNLIKNADAKVFVESKLNPAKDNWYYKINITGNEKVSLSFEVPQEFELKYISAKKDGQGDSKWQENVDYTIQDNVIKLNNTIDPGVYYIGGIINSDKFIDLNLDNSTVELSAIATISTDTKSYKSNENIISLKYENVSISMTSPNEGEEVKYGDEIDYQITIKNIGGTNLTDTTYSTNINLLDYLPKNIIPKSVTYENYEEILENVEYNSNGEITAFTSTGVFNKVEKTEDIYNYTDENENIYSKTDLILDLPYGETSVINIKAAAGLVHEKTRIENSATVAGISTKIKSKTSNIVAHTILPYNSENPTNPDNPVVPDEPVNPDEPVIPDDPNNNPNNPENKKYTISGVAWNDENKDGKRQSEEKLLSGIEVMLVNADNSTISKETLTTNNNGQYSFSDLDNGNYIILFKYDTDMYLVTDYQKEGVSDSENSDAISKTVTLQGKPINVAVTDSIALNSNITNIDLGLIQNKNCDLSIDKYISKIIVQTNKGTKEHTYNNSKIEKAEINAKEIEGSLVVVEYKLAITNQGEISASVGNITDYIPDGLTFSSELNKNWSSNTNGQIINVSYANSQIQPGETVEIPLVLTKKMTANTTGTFTNKAEIFSINNSQGTSDINKDNNISTADLIISISTGGVVIYAIIIITIIIILSISLYLLVQLGYIKIGKITLFSSLFLCILGLTTVYTFSHWENGWICTCPYLSGNSVAIDSWINTESSPFKYDGNHTTGYNGFFKGNDNTGDAYGIEHGVLGSGNNGTDLSEITRTYYANEYYRSNISINNPDLNFTMSTNANIIELKTLGDYYLVGPLTIDSSNNGNYTFELYDNNGDIINDTNHICDSNGNSITIEQNSNFYLKVVKSNCINGIARIKASTTNTGTKTTRYRDYGHGLYLHDTYQNVKTIKSFKYKDYTKNENVSLSKSLEWTNINGGLEIIKQDTDDINIKLDNVKIEVTGPNDYNKTFTTNSNGKISIENLPAGTYNINEISNDRYGYTIKESATVDIQSGVTRIFTLENTKQTGNLEIVKKDNQNNSILADVSFKIKDSNQNYIIAIDNNGNVQNKVNGTITLSKINTTKDEKLATEFITDENGKININNLLTGKYFVKEISVGNNDAYEVDKDYIYWEANGIKGEGDTASVIVQRQKSYETVSTDNIIFDDQKLVKDGVYEIETCANPDLVLDVANGSSYNGTNVEIYTKNNSMAQQFYFRYLGNGEYNIINMATNKNIEKAGGASSSSNNVQMGQPNLTQSQIWKIESAENGYYNIISKYNGLYLTVNGTPTNKSNVEVSASNLSDSQKFKFNDKTLSNTNNTILTIKSDKKYVDLLGYVWEDGFIDNKQDSNDGLYEDNSKANDKLLNDITVRLKQKTDTKDILIKEVKTTNNGSYKFDNAIIRNLDSYYVEFEYDGLTYSNVIPNVNKSNGSKASENTTIRDNFNNNFSIVEGKDNSSGYTKNSEGQQKWILKYTKDKDNYKSTFENNGDYKIVSNTKDANYNLKDSFIYENSQIDYINLGLYKKEQPDIAIVNDLENVITSIKENDTLYYYSERFDNKNDPIYTDNNNYTQLTQFNSSRLNSSYIREINKKDLEYGKDSVEQNELQVYVTYRIDLVNQSENLQAKVNSISQYYDSNYTLKSIGTTIDRDGNIKGIGNFLYKDSNYNDKYKKVIIDTSSLGNIGSRNTKSLYVQFELSRDSIEKLIDIELNNVAEINSYSIFDTNGKDIYSGIDVDSNPGNTISGDVTTYEDDTDKAPGLKLQLDESTGPEIPEGVSGWYTPDNEVYYYVRDGAIVKGWLVTESTPFENTGELQRFWLDLETGILARNKAIQTSGTTYSYAKNDGTIVRSTYNDSYGHIYMADNDGNLLWGNKTSFIIADYGEGKQRYYIDETTHSALSGFFFVNGYGKCFGTEKGYVLRGKMTWKNHVLLADNDGKLVDMEGWLVTDTFDDKQLQRYRIDCAYTDYNGVKYYGAHVGLFDLDGSLYYGKPNDGYVARNETITVNGQSYKADNDGKLVEVYDWTLEAPDWGQDDAYLESCRARAIANNSATNYYITIDNRWEGGGRVIVFQRDGNSWIALCGWYANVGRWTGSGDNIGTRSIPGIHKITHRWANGTGSNGWTPIPYFVCYVDYWTGYPHDAEHDDGQGFHYTPNPNAQGNDMSGCCAFTTEWRAKWIFDNVPDNTSVDVFGAAHGVHYD